MTSLDAFSVGTPVVTLPNAQARAGLLQLTAAMYELMRMHEPPIACCAARDVSEYVDITTRLAGNQTFRAAVSNAIQQRRQVLFENPQVVREWEDFLVRAVRNSQLR